MDLSVALNEAFSNVFNVELLPQYLMPGEFAAQGWCVLDGVLGIDAKGLCVAYVQLCKQGLESSTPDTSLLSILATTDNLKVLNARKRMCLAGALDAESEWHVVNVLLRSHLYKHSKSTMLWYHRQWLLKKFGLTTSVTQEFEVVKQAASHHPKNYYAWGYLRWYCDWINVRSNAKQYEEICDLVKQLCLYNLGDVSMWSFLHWLNNSNLEAVASETSKQFPGHEAILASTL